MPTEHEFLISLKLKHGRDYSNEVVKDAVLDALHLAEEDIHKHLFKTVDFAIHVVDREAPAEPEAQK